MEYMTVREAAAKWQLSVRRVQMLCAEERIAGLEKFGTFFAIPKDAERPADGRVKSGEYREWRKRYGKKWTKGEY